MKRTILSAVTAAMFFAACTDKEEYLVPQNQVQDEQIVNEVIQSNVITLEEARKNLENFLKDFSSLSKRGGDGFSSRKISDGFTLKSDKRSISKSTEETPEAKIHVFNFENNGGFAIMSATRDMPELLAITEGGSIDTNQVIDNPGLIMFLTNLEGKIKPSDKPYDPDDNIIEKKYGPYTNKIYNPIGGYCSVHWHQESPYNAYCRYEDGQQTITGCVAVACAQLMSVYRYPTSYDRCSFPWDDMIAGRNNNEVARLMGLLGIPKNLNMNYGVSCSTADPDNIPRTLRNFGYSNGGTLKGYNKSEIIDEIQNGYCVLLGGFCKKITKKIFGLKYDVVYKDGHRWLVHGALTRTRTITQYRKKQITEPTPDDDDIEVITKYESESYILCNFGWGGINNEDGYYLGDVFDTDKGADLPESISKSTDGYNFQYKLTMVTGIRR